MTPRLGLFPKLLIAFTLVLLPVLGLLVSSYRTNLANHETAILEGQTLTAQAVAGEIDATFDGAFGLAWAIAGNPLAREMDPRRLDPLLRRLVTQYPAFEAVGVFDAQGRNRGYGHPTLSPEPRFSIGDKAHFRAAMSTNAAAISAVFPLRRPAGVMGFAAAVPVRDEQGRPIGVVSVGVTAAQLAKRFEEARLQPGQIISLADPTGRLAFHTTRRSLTPAESESYRQLAPLRSALAGIPTSGAYLSPLTSEARLGAFVPTLRSQWAVIVGIPREVALAPAHERLRRDLLAFGGILLLSGAIAALLGRLLTRPIHALEEAARALGQGDLGRRAGIATGDELERVGAAFDEMAERLQVRDEALRESEARLRALSEDLERRVAERTRQLEALNAELEGSRAQLEVQFAQLKALDTVKGNFVSSVSHELRTPLTSIMGYAEFLEDGVAGPLTEDQRAFVTQIQAGTIRLQTLVDDLLDFARIDAGTFKLRLEHADLRSKVLEAVESLRPQAETSGLRLNVVVPETPVELDFDAQRVGQVVINLLTNAIKFTPAGGTVRLALTQEAAGVRCEVADSGVGIAAEDVPRLFQRFSQVGVQHRGTGLGLSISKSLVEAHGGEIGVRSAPGEGSTFWFTLPASPTGSFGGEIAA